MKSVLDVCAPRGKNRKVNPPPPPPVIIPEEDDIANADSSYLDSLMQLEQAATDGNNVEFRAAPGSYLEHVMQLEQEEMDRDAALRTLPVKETFDADDGLVENEDDSGKPEDDTGKLEDDEGYDAREDMLIEEVTKPIPVPGDDQHPNIPKFINGCRVKIAENVETADIDAGTIVFLDCPPPEKISPVGHPVTALADAIAAIGRKLPTDADVNGDGVTFQMGQIDYIVAPPVPGNPMPRWVSEISTEPLPNKPPMLPVIRMFGCTENELSVHLRIHAFEPYMFVRLPDGIDPAKVRFRT